MINDQTQHNLKLTQSLKEFCEINKDINLVSLCTTDGFPISHFSINELSELADRLAAMSSTLSALSDSSAKQMNLGRCDITIIETALGNTLFVKADYIEKPCVLTVVAKNKMMLATARYKTIKLAETISKITKQ